MIHLSIGMTTGGTIVPGLIRAWRGIRAFAEAHDRRQSFQNSDTAIIRAMKQTIVSAQPLFMKSRNV